MYTVRISSLGLQCFLLTCEWMLPGVHLQSLQLLQPSYASKDGFLTVNLLNTPNGYRRCSPSP